MRNQFLAIFFYLLYLLAMVRPLVPLMEYVANYDYIATVLCENKDRPYLECNGKCYLEEQLKNVNHDDHEHNSKAPLIDMSEYPISIIDQNEVNIVSIGEFKTRPYSYEALMAQNSDNKLLRPPQNLI